MNKKVNLNFSNLYKKTKIPSKFNKEFLDKKFIKFSDFFTFRDRISYLKSIKI